MSDYFDHGLNTAPEHGHRDFGPVGDGGPLPVGQGVRPPKPADPLGTVSDSGPASMQPYTDPGDSDNDMDADGPGDIDN